jgi:glycosyltransferase involved in cell wall biosynthesis
LPLLLKVWREICCKHNDVRLLLIGTGGLDIHNCEAELKSFVNSHCLEQYVQFTGSVQNVEEYLQSSDIFAFPTEDDALPSSLLEAMACALPVVTTPVGAIRTIVAHMQNGLIVQPGNFDQLYQALDTLILDQDLATRLGSVAWKTVQDRYAAEIVTKKYLSLFLNSVGG